MPTSRTETACIYSATRRTWQELSESARERLDRIAELDLSPDFANGWVSCYLNVAIGCTGGQHRSVYLAEKLAQHFRGQHAHVLTHHNELPG